MDTQALPADHSAGPAQAGVAHDRNRSDDRRVRYSAAPVRREQYLRDFSRVANERDSVQGMVEAMLARHDDWENPHTLWISAHGEIAKRS